MDLLTRLCSQWKDLTYLEVECNFEVTDEEMILLAKSRPEITHLGISNLLLT